jgi:hypothetical protein
MTSLNEQHPNARRTLIATRDQDGRKIVLVYLANGSCARLFRKDFKRLMRLGVSPNWCLNKDGTGNYGYVRAPVPAEFGWSATLMMLARMIVSPRLRGHVIRYRDGNPLNLRRDNLEMVKRATRAKAREHLLQAAA